MQREPWTSTVHVPASSPFPPLPSPLDGSCQITARGRRSCAPLGIAVGPVTRCAGMPASAPVVPSILSCQLSHSPEITCPRATLPGAPFHLKRLPGRGFHALHRLHRLHELHELHGLHELHTGYITGTSSGTSWPTPKASRCYPTATVGPSSPSRPSCFAAPPILGSHQDNPRPGRHD